MMAFVSSTAVCIIALVLVVMISKKWITLKRAVFLNTIIDLIFVGIAAASIELEVVYILCMLLLLVPATDIALIVGVTAGMKAKENQQTDHPRTREKQGMSKRRLILGTVVLILFSCLSVYVSIDFQNHTTAHGMVGKTDENVVNAVSGILALLSAGSAITAIGISLGIGGSSLKVLRESSIATTVPLYFVFGFAPVAYGVTLIVILGNISFGVWLVGIGVLTMLILLGLALKA